MYSPEGPGDLRIAVMQRKIDYCCEAREKLISLSGANCHVGRMKPENIKYLREAQITM